MSTAIQPPTPVEQQPIEVPVETQEPRRRFPSFRRNGKVAVAETVTVDSLETPEVDLMGLESELFEYSDLWAQHNQRLGGLITDQSASVLGAALTEIVAAPDNRDVRRGVNRTQASDFKSLAAIFVTAGRVKVTSSIKHNYREANKVGGSGGSIKDMRAELVAARETKERIEAKRLGLIGNLPAGPAVEKLRDTLSELEEATIKTYKPIVKQERKIKEKITKQFDDDPAAALRFLDTFLSVTGSETASERAFATLVANDYVQEQEYSTLSDAMAIVESMVGNGILRNRFIQEKIAENGGDNTMAFFAKLLKQAGFTQPIEEYMANNKEQWPQELAEEYEQYGQELLLSYRQRLTNAIDKSVNKAWLVPNLDMYEDAVDRQFKKMHGSVADKRFVKPAKSNGKGTQTRYRANPADFIASATPEEEKEPLTLAKLSRAELGFRTEAQPNDDDFVLQFIDKSMLRDANYVRDIKKVIDRLKIEPFGPGVHSFQRQGGTIEVNGKRSRLYKAAPHLMPGVSVVENVKSSRVVFAVQGGQLAVFAIPHDHQDYVRLIENIL